MYILIHRVAKLYYKRRANFFFIFGLLDYKEVEWLIGTETEIHCCVTTFVKSATLSADYVCLVSYISSDGHFSEVYIDCLVTARCAVLQSDCSW